MPNPAFVRYIKLCSDQLTEIPDLPPLICSECNLYHSFGGIQNPVPDMCEVCVCIWRGTTDPATH